MKKKRGQGIVRVSDLFKKYKENLKAPQATVIDGFIETVYEVAGIEIYKHQCSYTPQTHTLAITAPGPVKSEVLLRKEEIFKKLSQKIGAKSVPKDIL